MKSSLLTAVVAFVGFAILGAATVEAGPWERFLRHHGMHQGRGYHSRLPAKYQYRLRHHDQYLFDPVPLPPYYGPAAEYLPTHQYRYDSRQQGPMPFGPSRVAPYRRPAPAEQIPLGRPTSSRPGFDGVYGPGLPITRPQRSQ